METGAYPRSGPLGLRPSPSGFPRASTNTVIAPKAGCEKVLIMSSLSCPGLTVAADGKRCCVLRKGYIAIKMGTTWQKFNGITVTKKDNRHRPPFQLFPNPTISNKASPPTSLTGDRFQRGVTCLVQRARPLARYPQRGINREP